MKVTPRLDLSAVVLQPEPGDDPDDLEDVVHDQVTVHKVTASSDGGLTGSRVKVVVLDLEGVPNAPAWMKVAGPEQPDVNLRLALGKSGYAVARRLGIPAYFQWYATVDEALTGGV